MPTPRVVQTANNLLDRKFVTVPQLCERWAGCSYNFVERLIANDPNFPRPVRLGKRVRFFAIDEIEAYERSRIARPQRAKVST